MMKKSFKALSMILALIMVMALLAGCATKADSDYEYIKKKNLIVGITQYHNELHGKDGNLTGFDTELTIAVCEGSALKLNC